jgi:small subunit ribosomal protein S6
MRDYEAMVLLSPELDDEGVGAAVEDMTGVIEGQGGTVTSAGQLMNAKGHVAETVETWKARKLAYQIKSHKDGYYVVLRFNSDVDVPQELERRLKLDETVLRYLVLRDEGAEPAASAEE